MNATVTSSDNAEIFATTNSAVSVTADNTTTSVTVKQNSDVTDFRTDAVAEVKATQTVTFKDLTAGQTVTVNGLVFTASKALTADQVAAAFANLTASDTQSATGVVANGYYTTAFSTVAGWTSAAANGASVTFTAPAHNSADLDTSTTGTALTVATIVKGTLPTAAVDSDDTTAYGTVTINDNATASITDVTLDGYGATVIGTTTALTKLANLSLADSAGAVTVDTDAGITSLNLTVNDVNHAIDISTNSTTVATLNVTTAGEDSTFALTAEQVKYLNVSGTTDLDLTGSVLTLLEDVVVSGTAGLDLGAVVAAKSINTTATTGDVTATINGTTATYTGGAGVDTVTLVTGTALTKAISLGAGDDTVVFNAAITGSTAALNAGDGTDTLSMAVANAAGLDAAAQTFYTNFERLTLNNAYDGGVANNTDTETINLANLGFTSYVTTSGTLIDAAGQSDILVLDKLAANATVVLTAQGYITAQLTDATGTADVINVVLADGTANVGTFTAAGVETINVTTTDLVTDVTGATDVEGAAIGDGIDDTNTASTLALTTAAATTINVTGAGDLTLTTTSTVVTAINASTMTGELTYDATVNSVVVTGGSADDLLTATADDVTLKGEAGDDWFVVMAGADRAILNGGAGNDTFEINGASSTSSTYANISAVATGDTIKFTGADSFAAAKVTLSAGATESTQALMDLAIQNLDANDMGWFQTGGNTFIVMDVANSGTSFTDGTDKVVMITGLVDLSTASYNMTSNTLEIA